VLFVIQIFWPADQTIIPKNDIQLLKKKPVKAVRLKFSTTRDTKNYSFGQKVTLIVEKNRLELFGSSFLTIIPPWLWAELSPDCRPPYFDQGL